MIISGLVSSLRSSAIWCSTSNCLRRKHSSSAWEISPALSCGGMKGQRREEGRERGKNGGKETEGEGRGEEIRGWKRINT